MDIEHLKAFVAVSEAGSVSSAARDLGVTQPAVTRQLQKLSRDVGLVLFDRVPSGLTPTKAGRDFLPAAKKLLTEFQHTLDFAELLAHGGMREVTIAAPGTTLIDVVIPFVATLDQSEWQPNIVEASLDASLQDTIAASDLAVMPSAPAADIPHVQLQKMPVWAYVSAQHPWAQRRSVPLEELAQHTIHIPSRAFKARRVFDGACETAGLSQPDIIETNSGRVAQALVATEGVAVVTEDPSFNLVPLRITNGGHELAVTLHAAWRADHYAHQELAALAEQLRVFVIKRYTN